MDDISTTALVAQVTRRYGGLMLMRAGTRLLRLADALRGLAEATFRRGIEMSKDDE